MAAVLPPLQGLSLNREIMDPSPISPNASRHGRGKNGGSVSKTKGRGRGYSTVEDREGLISKALTWVLKRTVEEGDEQDEGEEKLVADSEGWVECSEVLERSNLSSLEVTFPELKELVESPASRTRFSLKLKPDSKEDTNAEKAIPSNYLIKVNPTPSGPMSPTSATTTKYTPLSTTTEDLPDFIVYETSYANYPLILASGGIKRAGGQALLTFATIVVQEDGSEVRAPKCDADVSIHINLRQVMEAEPKIRWARTDAGHVVTEGDASGGISKANWKKAVARRADIGVLFENGEVRKEVPVGLRGKGVKAKKGGKGKGKGGLKEMKTRSEDDDTASD
ncbi:related to tRNA 2`-phosphotransferase [Rhynchosporium secalis]|uniref:2'-phosphotransferase n=1 Tax=Rhynchosporium secalis TaxID=38038 RepID=A0A1E1M4V3_RHYSE|nr:related to tRNA 2`-phosphotransferase [Rhynchosporium secalis]